MTAFKLASASVSALATVLLYTSAAATVPESAEPTAPSLSEAHRKHLSRIVRRTVRDTFAGAEYEPGYVPAALRESEVEVVVQLRDSGYLLAAGVGGPAPAAKATRDAAATAAKTLIDDKLIARERIHELLIEIEVVGEAVAVPFEGDWTLPGVLDPLIEPGVHGMAVIGSRGIVRFCPSEVFTSDVVLGAALKRLARETHSDPGQLPGTRLMRFRTAHWYQSPGGDDIVSLQRGLTIVPQSAVSRRGLDDAVASIAQYMAYRQLDSGLFTYQYEAGLDRYSGDNSLIRQAGATAAMAFHARRSGKSASQGAADVGIRYHLQGLTGIPEVEGAAFIATADGANPLGLTAMVCAAMAQHPDAERFEDTRAKLVNGMLWLQRPAGLFVTAFPPAEQLAAQDYFPGEALHALALEYEHEPHARILEAFARSIDFYREYFRHRQAPPFISWQVQAYAAMATHSKRKDYADYVFELSDWLVARQLDESNCRWPELIGGIAAYKGGRADVSTASYLEALADALSLARRVGDAARAKRYEAAVRKAARFVMQLQVRPEEAYFVRSPRDAIGGIRRTPTLNLLRISHCQHALVALIKTRDALYP